MLPARGWTPSTGHRSTASRWGHRSGKGDPNGLGRGGLGHTWGPDAPRPGACPSRGPTDVAFTHQDGYSSGAEARPEPAALSPTFPPAMALVESLANPVGRFPSHLIHHGPTPENPGDRP